MIWTGYWGEINNAQDAYFRNKWSIFHARCVLNLVGRYSKTYVLTVGFFYSRFLISCLVRQNIVLIWRMIGTYFQRQKAPTSFTWIWWFLKQQEQQQPCILCTLNENKQNVHVLFCCCCFVDLSKSHWYLHIHFFVPEWLTMRHTLWTPGKYSPTNISFLL